ncbi:unnamed protein product [Merluccius merluccius]
MEDGGSSDEVHTLSGSNESRRTQVRVLVLPPPGPAPLQARTQNSAPCCCGAARRPPPPGILSFGNVLNYMDRYTVADDVSYKYRMVRSIGGLCTEIFICSFMVAAPIFGYLGDRFNRKVILSCGIFFWSIVTLFSSFISKEYYWVFLLSRSLVGIGESSYSSISPTIIGDLFTNNSRTMMLSVFYLAIPLGSGLGYILGSGAKEASGDWHWALRVSPLLGIIAGALILLFVPEPKRGRGDEAGSRKSRSSWCCDMKALAKNRSYVFSSLASAAVSFATGAFGVWIPSYLSRAQVVQKTAEVCTKEICSSKDSLIFGAITCVTGLLGVLIGAATTRLFRQRTERADPLVCAVSMLGSAIFICLIFVVAKKSIAGAYVNMRTYPMAHTTQHHPPHQKKSRPIVTQRRFYVPATPVTSSHGAGRASHRADFAHFVRISHSFSSFSFPFPLYDILSSLSLSFCLSLSLSLSLHQFVVIPTRRATAVAFQSFTSHLLGDAGSPYLIGLVRPRPPPPPPLIITTLH